MSRRLYFLAAIGATAIVALAIHAVAQPPATTPLAAQPAAIEPRSGTDIVEGPNGTIVEQTLDGKKLQAQEQSAAQEARALAAEYAAADSDSARDEAKTKLREKLAAVFDLQQQRRAREISQIEERLGKLKETMKKRDLSKDPIIDRRVEQLTGGVDELGWEETGGHQPNFTSPYPYNPGNSFPRTPNVPGTAPGLGLPSATPPVLPAPVPVPPQR